MMEQQRPSFWERRLSSLGDFVAAILLRIYYSPEVTKQIIADGHRVEAGRKERAVKWAEEQERRQG
jgi:hypothetical protein